MTGFKAEKRRIIYYKEPIVIIFCYGIQQLIPVSPVIMKWPTVSWNEFQRKSKRTDRAYGKTKDEVKRLPKEKVNDPKVKEVHNEKKSKDL